ncbi:hypothetical protein EYC80_010593 [Monilinia laxa]|uniref:Uncharacterized protein n=1 Tax=Monilinia laxa TaxID=61186 RepID=A0A5N6JMT3_MONLA|nr:hypothetical protein EYC80_010593 [Monilinia laxa]
MKFISFISFTALSTAIFAAPQLGTSHFERNEFHSLFSSFWSGVMIARPNEDMLWTHVTAHFIVPTPRDKKASAVLAGVAIDNGVGEVRNDAKIPSIATSIHIVTDEHGNTTYKPFYQWFPSPVAYFTSDSGGSKQPVIHPGDELTLGISMRVVHVGDEEKYVADARIANARDGSFFTTTINAPERDEIIGGNDAYFFASPPQPSDLLLNFGSIAFTKCAVISDGDAPLSVDVSGVGLEDSATHTPISFVNFSGNNLYGYSSTPEGTSVQIAWKSGG